jgi:hypothetical protein
VLVHAAQNAHGICKLCAGNAELFRNSGSAKGFDAIRGVASIELEQSGSSLAQVTKNSPSPHCGHSSGTPKEPPAVTA